MPTTLEIRFPWGRYHANPWGRHVNEGVIEWPPSPWRLVRALYATWRARAPDLPRDVVHSMLSDLAAPPKFVLPEFTEAHTRHYMPDVSFGTDLAFDAFASLERDACLLVEWPVDLKGDEEESLARLASLLPYLGRAESICDARLVSQPSVGRGERLVPLEDDEAAGASPLRLLVPRTPLDVDALTVRTLDVRKDRLVDPPGAYRQPYTRPEPAQPLPQVRRREMAKPTAVRWALAASALPSRHAAVVMAHVLRQACMAAFGQARGGAASPILAGKDEHGRPLEGHGHAHYVAVDSDGDGLLDHLVLWAPEGLGQRELTALARIERLVGFAHVPDFRPARLGLEALGQIGDVAPELVGPARLWRSVTPFAPTRHSKRRIAWPDHVASQVADELSWRGLPAPVGVRLLKGDWLAYRRHRPAERLEDGRRATGIEIEFDEPIRGPLALGALSHFGLGLFAPT